MKYYYWILLVFVFCSCNKKAERKEISIELDTVTTIRVLKLEQSIAAIIPANYYIKRKYLENNSRVTGFFTPDEKTVKEIEKKLPEQSSVIDNYYNWAPGWQTVFNINAKDTPIYDKQYKGYIDAKKDSIIGVTLFNLETDPYKVREGFDKDDRICFDGWCNTNVCALLYNKRTKKFNSIYEDH